jgi:hypothetical protein
LRCELCFHIGAAVRVGARLLCGACFHDVALSEEAKRMGTDERHAESSAA